MFKKYIEDPLFKILFDGYFPEGITDDSIGRMDNTINKTFELPITMEVLNIVKASVISENTFGETYDIIKDFLSRKLKGKVEQGTDFFIMSLTLRYLMEQKVDGVETLIKEKRNFIDEAIAEHLKIPISDVTDAMRADILENSDSVYSITDPPVSSWDEYFFNICRQVARNSKCLSRRIGAVLVQEKSIIGTGYNGPSKKIPRCDQRWKMDPNFIKRYQNKVPAGTELEGKCPRYPLGAKSGEMLHICTAAHAEENSIIDAAYRGVATKGATMYMTCGIPCTQCLIKIINAGIAELVVTGITFYDENAEFLLNNSDVKVRLYNFENNY